MSEKIKVGNAEVEKANYDYFSLMYEKMPKEYVVADLVSKCEDYYKLYKNYEMKDLQIEEIRKELINQDKYIGKLKEEYANQLQQKENIIKEVREYIEKNTRWFDSEYAKTYGELCTCAGANDTRLEVLVNPSNLLKILDKTN